MVCCNATIAFTSFNIYENIGGRGTWTSFQVSSIWKLLTSIYIFFVYGVLWIWYDNKQFCGAGIDTPGILLFRTLIGKVGVVWSCLYPPTRPSSISCDNDDSSSCWLSFLSFILLYEWRKKFGLLKLLHDLKDCTVEKLEMMDFDSSFELLLWQILGSIGSVGGGLALGKEGPLVHTGACIASVLGQVKS